MDIMDRAQKIEQEHLRTALAQRQSVSVALPSREFCLECEAPIPQGRRDACPGCQLCVKCQQDLEKPHGRF